MESKLKMILAIVNNKGGVGKTTTVQNLAAGMLRKNKKLRILEIDLDPQCNLTLLNHAPEGCATIFESMIECKGLPIYKSEIGVYYVPGSAKMQDVDPFLQNTGAPRQVLGACINSDSIDMTGEGIKIRSTISITSSLIVLQPCRNPPIMPWWWRAISWCLSRWRVCLSMVWLPSLEQ